MSTSRRLATSLLAVGLVPAVLAFPVVSAPHPTPHPVKGHVSSVSLRGVDGASWAALQGESRAVPVARRLGALAASRPAVLTGQVHAATFSAIGVTWKPTASAGTPTVHVRVHQDGRWTGWETLTVSDLGPDAATAESHTAGFRMGTEPLLTDPSDAYEVRVDGTRLPDDLRVDLVDPGTSAADDDLTPSAPPASALATTNAPTIITRAQWGADESIRQCCPVYMPTIVAGFIHHTDSTNTYTAAGAAAQVRAIYLYHVKSNGWSDIGYNFLVDRFGRVFEGRYGGIDKAVRGAHTGGFNTNTFGVAALGTFTTTAPTSAMLSGIERIFAYKLDLNHRDPLSRTVLTASAFSGSRYAAGTKVGVNVISGHRDMDYTTCPGNALYAKLPAIRSAVRALIGTALFDPTQSLVSVPQGYTTPLVVSARTAGTQSWRLVVTDQTGAVVRNVTGTAAGTFSTGWDLTVNGQPAPPGTYTITLTSSSGGVAARPYVGALRIVQTQTFDPPAPAGTPTVFWKPGYQVLNGHPWSTSCRTNTSPGGYLCLASRESYYVVRTSSGYAYVYGWGTPLYNFVDHATAAWSTNSTAVNGSGTTSTGRKWKTECDSTTTAGPRSCRSYQWRTVVSATRTAPGTYSYTASNVWVLTSQTFLVP